MFMRAGRKKKTKTKDSERNLATMKTESKAEAEMTKRKKKKQEANEDKARVIRFVNDQTQIQRAGEQGKSGGNESNRSEFQLAYDRIKVFYGYLQIFSSLTLVFIDCPWPGLLPRRVPLWL